jgi:hypothetical protein
MAATAALLRLLHLGQACVAGYGLYTASGSITNLQKYEKKSEKAAQWSEAAAEQLSKTRWTQGAGAVAVSLAFLILIIISCFIAQPKGVIS